MASIWRRSTQGSHRRQSARRLTFVRPVVIERLECRTVLSSATISGTTLIIEGNLFGNDITLRLDPDNSSILQVDDDSDGTPQHTFNRSQFNAIQVDGKGGGDRLVVDEFNGAFTDTEQVTLLGGNGDDRLVASGAAGSVHLDGGNDKDDIVGGRGNDRLISGKGSTDQLRGLEGNDTYVITLEGGDKRINDASGTDTVSFVGAPVKISVDLSRTDDQLVGNETQIVELVGIEGVIGTSFDDFIVGDAGNNELNGAGGNDIIRGGLGNDTVEGAAGNDSITGSNGNDLLDGGSGNDTLRGEDNNDTLISGSGNDILDGAGSNDTYTPELGGDVSILDSIGTDHIVFGNTSTPITIDLALTSQTVDDAGHRLDITGTIENVTGTLGSDRIRGGAARNFLDGGLFGNDTLIGVGNDDSFAGGVGNDTYVLVPGGSAVISDTGGLDALDFSNAGAGITLDLSTTVLQTVNAAGAGIRLDGTFESVSGTSFADAFTGNTAANSIQSGGGADSILGGAGNDNLNGGAGNDTLRGEAGNDNLNGGGDSDVLEGALGSDTLVGAGGNDTYLFGPVIEGGDRVSDNSGVDRLDFTLSPLAITIDLALDASQVQTIDSAGHTLILEGVIERATGSEFDDMLNGNSSANAFIGLGGNDTLNGLAGNDTLNGSSGNDSLRGGDSDDSLLGGTGDDSLFGEEGNDTLSGGSGVDVEDGGPGQDGIVIEGTSGNDVIRVGRQMGPNGAQVVFRINGQTFVEDYLSGETIFIRAGGGNDLVVFDETAGETWSADIQGGAGRDTLRGSLKADTLDGGDGRDVLVGRGGNDVLIGGAGRDRFVGGPGADEIFAADGTRDRVFADFDDVAGSLDSNDRIRRL